MFAAPHENEHRHSALEEAMHTLTHGLGALLAMVAVVFLAAKAATIGGPKELTAVALYGISSIVLYVCSTLYHGAYRSSFQPFLEALDHSAIFVKIAGSYTPFALLTLSALSGTVLMIVLWVAAVIGIALKFTGHFLGRMRQFDRLSVLAYLAMGWAGLFVIFELWQNLPRIGFAWLVAGGLCFTIGAGFYRLKDRAWTHTIFHLFVLAGSICHFIAVYGYVLASSQAS